ncbi:MAG: MFS transporter [Bacteroidetes bacterium]|nr:MFS transporter [Bacteroidota bacterium]MCW5894486.1 MFS transporter [Bacteroidota bacterium]
MEESVDRQKVDRKNFVLNFSEGALFAASGSLMSPQTVLPVIVAMLGGSNITIGALSVIVWVGLFLPQIFAARYVETLPWKKPWAIKFGIAQRVTVLCIGVGLLLFGADQPALALVVFFVFYSLCQILLGVTTPGWFDMFAKMVPTRKRGRLVGIRSSLGGIGAFCCGLILTWLLARFPFPLGFAFAFFLAFGLQSASILVQMALVETEPSPTSERQPLAVYLRDLPRVLRENAAFKHFLVASMFQIVASMPVGFYAVYAMSRFDLNKEVVGTFTLAIVGVQVATSLLIGYLSDKRGNKLTLVLAAVALLCANVMALFAPSADWFFLVFLFLGINLGTELLARYNIAVEYSPLHQRSRYVGLMNTILAPFYIVGLLGGTISEVFGYSALFAVGIIASIAGVAMTMFRVQDPRKMFSESHTAASI